MVRYAVSAVLCFGTQLQKCSRRPGLGQGETEEKRLKGMCVRSGAQRGQGETGVQDVAVIHFGEAKPSEV